MKPTYKFYIEWNTGDMYWDNFPDIDGFEGTVEGLNEHLNSRAYYDDEKASLTDEDVTNMLNGETVYDPTGECWSVEIKEGDR
jgi:hypothetical protein